jgi:serine/threonine-protein kinase
VLESEPLRLAVPGPERKLPTRVGRYEVELMLGQGGLGRTLLARDPVIGRQVALRVVRDDLGLSAERQALVAEQLRQRGRAVAAFAHPAMAILFDAGDDEAAGTYLVFELLQGSTLRETIQRGPLARREVAKLARTLGPALAAVHSAGLVHGNVKPDNVAWTAAGPKLTGAGFGPPSGIAPALADPLVYCAPEALDGRPQGAAADQFSLAATLYEALTGRPPFGPFAASDARAAAEAVARAKHPAPTAVLPELRACPHIDTIFDRALAKEPHRRFPACDAFSSALAGSLETEAVRFETPLPHSQASIVPRATRRWQNAAAGAAVAVIFGLVLLGREPRGAGVSLKSVAGAFAMTLAASSHGASRPRPTPPVSPGAASLSASPRSIGTGATMVEPLEASPDGGREREPGPGPGD